MRMVLRASVVLVVLAAGIAGNVLLVRGQNNSAELMVGGALVTIVGFVALEALLSRIAGARGPQITLDQAADALAVAVRGQWETAALERGLIHPLPLPVRWRWTRLAVTGPVSDAVGDAKSNARFAPQPGIERVTADRIGAGRLRDLFSIYAGLDSGRLVIVGPPGAGKTAAAILLVVDALKRRDSLAETERRLTPVPVLLSCRGWDPAEFQFVAWITEQLRNSYAFLRAPEYGTDATERLVTQGRVAVVLDGFDEAPPSLRPAILGCLNAQAHCRLILVTRSDELVGAVAGGHLSGSAALELLPVTRDEAADYLERCRAQPATDAWQRLVEHIRNSEETTIAEALNNPLTLTLVRDTFHVDDDADLLTADRFTDSDEVVEFLLDRVLPAAYLPRPGRPAPAYTLTQATRCLGFAARQMNGNGTRDLAWWQVPAWRHPAPRAAVNGVLAALVFALLGWLAFGARFAVLVGLLGLLVGTLVGAFAEWRADDRPVKLGATNWRALGSPGSGATNVFGLITGVSYGLVGGTVFAIEGGVALGVAIGMATTLAFMFATSISILIATPSAEADSPIDPMTAWRRDRTAGIVIGVAFGLAFGTMSGVAFVLAFGVTRGLTFGVAAGAIAGAAIALTMVRSWDSRLAFFQIWRAGWGPVNLMRFLEDAHSRGVLRTLGPVYQFRHARLHDRLAARQSTLTALRQEATNPLRHAGQVTAEGSRQ